MSQVVLYVVAKEGGQPFGPVTAADVVHLLQTGQLTDTALVAPPGASSWTPVTRVNEFVAALRVAGDAAGGQQGAARPPPPSAALVQADEETEYRRRIQALKQELESVEEALNVQSFGFYKPRYGFPEASDYEFRLIEVREKQKYLLKAERATESDTTWTVDGSAAKGRKMMADASRLMLRAFNGECDAAISRVKYDNVEKLEQRISKSCEAINKLGSVNQLRITREYHDLKLEELWIVHEHREKVQEEKELEQERRAQMREEERAQQEFEKDQHDAEKDEQRCKKELDKARAKLADASGAQLDRLQGLIERLENDLHEAIDRKAKAIARAQLTRSGHVYVLSNVGAFGDGVFKIGMTRRLEPLDRVRELGDASVPFFFDVHAMIYTEDAPALEAALHREFEGRRLNLVNVRREFFRVSLDEIRAAVAKHHGQVTFVTHAEAEQFRKSVAMAEARAAHIDVEVEPDDWE